MNSDGERAGIDPADIGRAGVKPGTAASAAILAIGDELTRGESLDTNSQWLAARLMERGIVTTEHATVADDLPAIVRSLTRLTRDADAVIVTGGLGPTADDLTRQALADAMREPLVEDQAALDHLARWFAARGRPMPVLNRVQALRPASARILPNPHGTAPGIAAEVRAGPSGRVSLVFCLPGPPREMQPMFLDHVAPLLSPPPGRLVRTHLVHTFGLGESDIATRLAELMDRTRVPVVGTTASGGVVTCRVRYEGPLPPDAADASMAATVALVRDRLDPYVFGEGAQTLAGVLLELLRSRRERLAVVESCTGGLLGAMLTEVPGSSAAFIGGWITYSNDAKSRGIGVPHDLISRHGAVSREVAEAMARGGLDRAGADHALAITGIAGPDGGSAQKPVGTVWIARASRAADAALESRRFRFSSDRPTIRAWAASSAAAMLRFHLAGRAGVPMLGEQNAP